MNNCVGSSPNPNLRIAQKRAKVKSSVGLVMALLGMSGEATLAESIGVCARNRTLGRRAGLRRIANGVVLNGAIGDELWLCRSRACPLCCADNAASWGLRASQSVVDALKENPSLKFLALTLKSRFVRLSEIGAAVRDVVRAFSVMKRDKRLRRFVAGYVRVVEVAVSPITLLASVHIHAAFAFLPDYFAGRNYLSKRLWGSLWRSSLGSEYSASVDVRNVLGASGSAVARHVGWWVEYALLGNHFVDVVKIAENDMRSASEAFKAVLEGLKGARLVSSGGVLKS